MDATQITKTTLAKESYILVFNNVKPLHVGGMD